MFKPPQLNQRLRKSLAHWGMELFIVILGILIALAAQEWIVDRQWQARMEEARTSLAREIGALSNQMFERLIIQKCLETRLQALADQLDSPSTTWRASPEQFVGAERYYSNALPVVYRPPRRDMVDGIWVNVQNDGTLRHFDPSKAEDIANIYSNAAGIQTLFEREQELAAQLGPLGKDRELGQSERFALLKNIHTLYALNNSLLLAGKRLIDDVGELDLPYDASGIRRARQRFLELQQGYRGNCVEKVPWDVGFGGNHLSNPSGASIR